MKKIITFLILIAISPKVNALSANLNITCDKDSVTPNTSITCNINANVNSGSIYAYSGEFVLSDNLELISTNVDSNKWQGGVTGSKIGIYSADSYNNNVNLLKTVLKTKESSSNTASIKLNNNSFTDENYSTVKYNETTIKNITIEINSNEKESTSIKKDDKEEKDYKETKNTNNNKNENENVVTKNPDTGTFISLVTTISLSILVIFVIIYFKKKSYFKRI